jgi:excisionase family DNA binding protein
MKRPIYTTAQAAAICRISMQTVIRCCRSGDLKHFVIPGSKHRRITPEALREWMERHGIPTEALDTPCPDPRPEPAGSPSS